MPFPNEEVVTADVLQTDDDATAQRIVIWHHPTDDAGIINFFSGDPDEDSPGFIYSDVVGAGAARNIFLNLVCGNFDNSSPTINMRSTSFGQTAGWPDEASRMEFLMGAQEEFNPNDRAEFIFNNGYFVLGNDINALVYGGIDHAPPTNWVNPGLTAPYTNVAGREVEYRRDLAGNIHLRGVVNRNAAGSGATLFTLPVGFRPQSTAQFTVAATPVGALGSITITSAGVVAMNVQIGAPTIYTVDCTFPGIG